MSRVTCPFALGSASTGSYISAVFSVSDVDNLISSSMQNTAGWPFRNLLFSGAAILAKFFPDRQKTLHSP